MDPEKIVFKVTETDTRISPKIFPY